MGQKQAGLGLLEFVIAAIVISILIVVFFSRVVRLSVAVEREAFQQTVNNLDSAIKLRWLALMVQGDENGVRRLEGSNPMPLLQQPPASYMGELEGPDPHTIAPQHWYFDTRQGVLVYRVANPEAVEGELDDPPRIRFRVTAQRNAEGRVTWMGLQALDPWRWKREGAR